MKRVIAIKTITCQTCGALLLGDDPRAERHQMTGLSRSQPNWPARARAQELLREGTTVARAKTCCTCANILKLEVARKTFVFVEGVEPANNCVERPLRRAVLWRRRSFGKQSGGGCRFVERVLPAVTALRQPEWDVSDYLTDACAAAIQSDNVPPQRPGLTAQFCQPGERLHLMECSLLLVVGAIEFFANYIDLLHFLFGRYRISILVEVWLWR